MVLTSSIFTFCTAVIGLVAAAPTSIVEADDQALERRGKTAPENVYYQACLDVTGNTCDSHGPALIGHCIEMDKRKYGFLEVENDTRKNCVVYHSPHHQCGVYYPKEKLRAFSLPPGKRGSVSTTVFSFIVHCN